MHKKKIIIFVFFIIIISLLCILYFNKKDVPSDSVSISSNESNIIRILDKYPMSDDMGKKIEYDEDNNDVQVYYEFEVKSTASRGTNFEIYISDEKFNNIIHSNYIKVYLTDEDNNPVSCFDNTPVPTIYYLKNSNNHIGKQLYYGYIKAGETKKYILRIWFSDAYTLGVTQNEYDLEINAEAE